MTKLILWNPVLNYVFSDWHTVSTEIALMAHVVDSIWKEEDSLPFHMQNTVCIWQQWTHWKYVFWRNIIYLEAHTTEADRHRDLWTECDTRLGLMREGEWGESVQDTELQTDFAGSFSIFSSTSTTGKEFEEFPAHLRLPKFKK